MDGQYRSISDILLLSLSLLSAIGWFIMSKRRKKKALKGRPSNKFAKSMSGARVRSAIKGKHAHLITVDDMIPLSEFDDGGEKPEPEVLDTFAELGLRHGFLKAARVEDDLLAATRLATPPAPPAWVWKPMEERKRLSSTPMSTPFIVDEIIEAAPYQLKPVSVDKDVVRCEWVFYAKVYVPGDPSYKCVVDARVTERAMMDAWEDKPGLRRLRDGVIKVWVDKAHGYYSEIGDALARIENLQSIWCNVFPDPVMVTSDPELDDGDAMSAQEVRALRKKVEGILWPEPKS